MLGFCVGLAGVGDNSRGEDEGAAEIVVGLFAALAVELVGAAFIVVAAGAEVICGFGSVVAVSVLTVAVVGLPPGSTPSAPDTVVTSIFGHKLRIAVLLKNIPISVLGYAFVPLHS